MSDIVIVPLTINGIYTVPTIETEFGDYTMEENHRPSIIAGFAYLVNMAGLGLIGKVHNKDGFVQFCNEHYAHKIRRSLGYV